MIKPQRNWELEQSGVFGEQALNELIAFLPRLLGALLLVVVAWAVAWGVHFLTRKGMQRARVDERLATGQAPQSSDPSLTQTVLTAAIWIVLVLFLPLILDVLALDGLLAPVSEMINDILVALPAVFGAVIIVAAAYVVGRLVRVLVTQGLAKVGFNRLGQRLGLFSEQPSRSGSAPSAGPAVHERRVQGTGEGGGMGSRSELERSEGARVSTTS